MVTALDRDGDKLVIKGKVFGAMPIVARLSPAEARRGLKLLNLDSSINELCSACQRSADTGC